MTYLTNQEVDDKILDYLTKQKAQGLEGGNTNATLALVILHEDLRPAARHEGGSFNNAKEVAGESARRLRKKGRISFNKKSGWLMAGPAD